jgi:O-succinylbenzoate synthase
MIHNFQTSFGSVDHKETVIVKLFTESGLVGYGEAAAINAPVYTHETAVTCSDVLQQFIAPQILGKDFQDATSFRAAYGNIIGNNAAKAGIECAFWNLLSLRDNISLKQLFRWRTS